MKHLEIKVPANTTIGVIGDIHEQEDQFNYILNVFQPNQNRLLVSLGDIYDKGFGVKTAESIVNKLIEIHESKIGFVILGNHDYKYVRKAMYDNHYSKQIKWLSNCPFSITFTFVNGKKLTVLHGGITPEHAYDDLSNSEILYVKTINGVGKHINFKFDKKQRKVVGEKDGLKSWHEAYDGRFGYIIAGHDAQKDGIVKYYPYSCNVDTACYYTGKLSCQVFDETGLQELIQSPRFNSKAFQA